MTVGRDYSGGKIDGAGGCDGARRLATAPLLEGGRRRASLARLSTKKNGTLNIEAGPTHEYDRTSARPSISTVTESSTSCTPSLNSPLASRS